MILKNNLHLFSQLFYNSIIPVQDHEQLEFYSSNLVARWKPRMNRISFHHRLSSHPHSHSFSHPHSDRRGAWNSALMHIFGILKKISAPRKTHRQGRIYKRSQTVALAGNRFFFLINFVINKIKQEFIQGIATLAINIEWILRENWWIPVQLFIQIYFWFNSLNQLILFLLYSRFTNF